jgi:CRP-like cAMP-binding protein
MPDSDSPLMRLVHKLGSRSRLGEEDVAAVLALPYTRRTFEAASYIVREGEPPRKRCSFVVSGYAFRQKLTVQGTRQIVSLHMAGRPARSAAPFSQAGRSQRAGAHPGGERRDRP